MTLRKLHARLAEIMEENERGGPDHASRNDREIMVVLSRTGRKRSWYYPIQRISSALCGVHLFDLDGKGGPVDILEIEIDSTDVRKVKPNSHFPPAE